MSIFRAMKKLGSVTVKTALLPVDLALDVCGVPILRDGNKTGVPFSLDRAKGIGSDLSDAYEETFDDD